MLRIIIIREQNNYIQILYMILILRERQEINPNDITTHTYKKGGIELQKGEDDIEADIGMMNNIQ